MKLWHTERLSKPLTPEQEQKRQEELSKVKITLSDRFVMIGTAFVCIFLPCVLILLGLAFFMLFLFGLL